MQNKTGSIIDGIGNYQAVNAGLDGLVPNRAYGSISVNCPKCGTRNALRGFSDKAPRCRVCCYPFVRQADLMLIVKACRADNMSDPAQAACAARLLKRLYPNVPQAAVAIAAISEENPAFPVSADERWKALNSAYAAGCGESEQYLNSMCRTNPHFFSSLRCPACGAAVYFDKRSHARPKCVFCLKYS